MKHDVIIGDCLDVLAQYPDNHFDLVITDPPYGIGENGKHHKTRGHPKQYIADNSKNWHSSQKGVKSVEYGEFSWDSKLSKECIDEIRRVSKNQIIFGGNYYADWLPPSSCWIVWNKKNGANDFADCELAWTSFKSATRLFEYRWHGMLQEDMKNKEPRVYPTQKPIALYKWLLEKYATPDSKVCDPFCGSGTIFAASNQLTEMNFEVTGIDKNAGALPVIQERGGFNKTTLGTFLTEVLTDG